MEISTAIKPTLQAMEVGDMFLFPLNKRGSVRTTTSNMKLDGFVFTTKMLVCNKLIIVQRDK